MARITDQQFRDLKEKYFALGRMVPLAFYSNEHTPVDLLKMLDDLRKQIINMVK